ncbi:hypothetical protein [Estrella lausannensis]|uniref:Uncharacterized protein n=1 Tax=Estrella lausannensis TaxID=483423 RepID=A0A0H5DPY0_9BACT|nr:hypothetical protein [Estrella lausannensis]CRX38073.1 hypothetical protein ELAC_0721 [Estrella lausannensis]
MLRFIIATGLFILPFVPQLSFAIEDTPPCFLQLEREFFNRKNVIEALAFARVQQGVWELIASDLDQKSGTIHAELKRRARELKPDPLEKPFNMGQSKKLLEQILLSLIKQAFVKYDVYRENDVVVTFSFLKDRQKRIWQECQVKKPPA